MIRVSPEAWSIVESHLEGAYPKEGKVTPQDLTATILHALGIDPASEIRDAQGRPLPASRGDVVKGIC